MHEWINVEVQLWNVYIKVDRVYMISIHPHRSMTGDVKSRSAAGMLVSIYGGGDF